MLQARLRTSEEFHGEALSRLERLEAFLGSTPERVARGECIDSRLAALELRAADRRFPPTHQHNGFGSVADGGSGLNAEMQDAYEQLQASRGLVEQLREQLSVSNAGRAALANESGRWQREAEAFRAENEELQSRCDHASHTAREAADLRARLAAAEQTEGAMHAQVAQMFSDVNALRSQLSARDADVCRLERRVAELEGMGQSFGNTSCASSGAAHGQLSTSAVIAIDELGSTALDETNRFAPEAASADPMPVSRCGSSPRVVPVSPVSRAVAQHAQVAAFASTSVGSTAVSGGVLGDAEPIAVAAAQPYPPLQVPSPAPGAIRNQSQSCGACASAAPGLAGSPWNGGCLGGQGPGGHELQDSGSLAKALSEVPALLGPRPSRPPWLQSPLLVPSPLQEPRAGLPASRGDAPNPCLLGGACQEAGGVQPNPVSLARWAMTPSNSQSNLHAAGATGEPRPNGYTPPGAFRQT